MRFVKTCGALMPADDEAFAWLFHAPEGASVQMASSKTRRSIEQNALFQVWARQFAAHLKGSHDVTDDEHEDTKYTLQRACYAATGWDFLIEVRRDLLKGKDGPPGRKSTAKLSPGEMFQFMEWVQMLAAEKGLILEAHGEYADLQQKAVG